MSDTSGRGARLVPQIESEGLVLSVTPGSNALAGTRHFAVFLRLTVDPDGRLVSGAIVDIEGIPRKQFMEWQELTPAVIEWLEGDELEGEEQEGGTAH